MLRIVPKKCLKIRIYGEYYYMKSVAEFLTVQQVDNSLEARFDAKSKNEKLSRNIVAAFVLELNPNVEELSDIKTAVSEAVTNAIVHGYSGCGGEIRITLKSKGSVLYVKIEDFGVGIKDIQKAREPFFTTGNTGERSGMGFTVMESFMDAVEVTNQKGTSGLVVEMIKVINSQDK